MEASECKMHFTLSCQGCIFGLTCDYVSAFAFVLLVEINSNATMTMLVAYIGTFTIPHMNARDGLYVSQSLQSISD